MSEIKRDAGSPLFCSVQLATTDVSKFVRGFVKNQLGADFTTPTIDLTHTSDGLYVNNDFVMPDLTQIKVVYRVFDDSGYSQESLEYFPVIELYSQPDANGSCGGSAFVSDEIVGVLESDEQIEGFLED
jgi:hypothetical protein